MGNTSLRIHVDLFLEKMLEEGREKVVSGSFTLVAINEHHKPVKII
ncbi:hypothetical protein LWM68_17860 [Niabella sp. W65]|nr:hypothetical protein [Niabella sp. W65]MCH7364449.1 hypothetical protein [Niabella sp. W65]